MNFDLNSNALSFKKNFSWTLFSSILFSFSQLFIISILAKLGSVELVGMYSLGLAISAPVFLFFSMNLRVVLSTDLKEEMSFSNYLMFRLFTSSIAVILIILLLAILNVSTESKLIIILISLVKWVESLSDISYGKFFQMETMQYAAISKIMRSILTIVVFLIVFLLSENLILSITFQLTSWMIILLLYDFKKLKKVFNVYLVKGGINKNKFKTLFLIAIPLGISGTLDSLNTNIPRYFISTFYSSSELGIYTGVTYIMIIGQVFISAMSNVVIPRLSKYYVYDLKKYVMFLRRLMILAIAISLLGILISSIFGDIILRILFSEEFSGYKNLLSLSMITASFWYMSGFLHAGIQATRKFKVQIPLFLITMVATLIFSIIFIPIFGIYGGVISLMIGYITRFLFSLIVVNRIIKLKI